VFRRTAGEALHPAREPLATLNRIRLTIGEYNFSSPYQQQPTPVGGAMVKTEWLSYYDPAELPETFGRIVQSWDTANKPSELADYSACTTWGIIDRKFYLLHVHRERLNYPELKRRVMEMASEFGAQTILIEDRASGTQLIQELQSESLYGITPYAPPPGTDKIMRLHAQTTMFANGHVLLLHTAYWRADYVNELISFPGSKYDDQVDSTTQALDYL